MLGKARGQCSARKKGQAGRAREGWRHRWRARPKCHAGMNAPLARSGHETAGGASRKADADRVRWPLWPGVSSFSLSHRAKQGPSGPSTPCLTTTPPLPHPSCSLLIIRVWRSRRPPTHPPPHLPFPLVFLLPPPRILLASSQDRPRAHATCDLPSDTGAAAVPRGTRFQ